MGFHLRDLPLYILIAAALGFFVYVSIQSWMTNKMDEDKDQTKK